jgi:uncharacterized membrane protein YgdD (TMEM256/DUF423 family)
MISVWQLFKSGDLLPKILLMLAALIQIFHGLALTIAANWAENHPRRPSIRWTGILFVFGLFFFAGPWYVQKLLDRSSTELFTVSMWGGVLLIVGWLVWMVKLFDYPSPPPR